MGLKAGRNCAEFRVEGGFRRGASGDVESDGFPTTTIIGSNGDGVDYAVTLAAIDNDSDTVYESVAVIVYGVVGKTVIWAITQDYQIVGASS